MPIYLYEVIREDEKPGERFEVVQGIKEPPLTEHPETGEPVQRIMQPCFAGGIWNEAAMGRRMKDDRKLEQQGFTKYVKAGDGVYEKRTGKGPDVITRDTPIQGSDLK